MSNYPCHGPHCSNIESKKDGPNHIVIFNTGPDTVNVKIVFADFLGGDGVSKRISLFSGEKEKVKIPDHLLGVHRIETS